MHRLLVLPACAAALVACSFDRSGVKAGPLAADALDLPVAPYHDAGRDGPGPHDWALPLPEAPGSPCAGLTCPLGCNTLANRCNRVKPTGHEAGGFFDQATGVIQGATVDMTIDTNTGEIRAGTLVLRNAGPPGTVDSGIYFGVVSQGPGYPEVAVFGMASLEVPTGRKLVALGQRALSIYTVGNVSIGGLLLAAGNTHVPGPGGGAGGLANGASGATCQGGEGQGGGQGGYNPDEVEAGGGGGGRGAAGGDGGAAEHPYYGYTAPAGKGGPAVGGGLPWPLFGGCGGGAGGGPDTGTMISAGGHGGGGGGAVQIVANGTLTVGGTVSVPGAGGGGGKGGSGGGGGGAGGAILLEAATVQFSGTLAANGGGGGAGASGIGRSAQDGEPGQNGRPNLVRANGGPDNPSWGGAGGQGGALPVATGGEGAADANAGGGGGGIGRIHINAGQLVPSGVTSPAASQGPLATW